MLRPFPIKALSDLLYNVEQVSGSLHVALISLQLDTPRDADDWAAALWRLDSLLWEVADYADTARAALPELVDRADVEAERAAVALRTILTGLTARAPKPCSACGGHGGWPEEGTCPTCQGSCIDPDDPASPL